MESLYIYRGVNGDWQLFEFDKGDYIQYVALKKKFNMNFDGIDCFGNILLLADWKVTFNV